MTQKYEGNNNPEDNKGDRVESREIRVHAKRRRGSFFTVGGLKRRTKTVSVTVAGQLKKRIAKKSPKKETPKVNPGVADEAEILHCSLCNTSFLNEKKMKLHFQYSTLHELNLKDSEKLKKAKHNEQDEEELKDATLVFKGSKFILKHNCMIECNIFEEEQTPKRQFHRLGILCYNVDKEERYSPIYLNGQLVLLYSQNDQEKRILCKEADIIVRKPDGKDGSDVNYTTPASGRSSQFSNKMGEWILKRIQYADPGGVQIIQLALDTDPPPLVKGPASIPGAILQHKRRFSVAKEFEAAEKKLTIEQEQANDAIAKAEELAKKTHMSITVYKKLFPNLEKSKGSNRIMSKKIFGMMGANIVAPIKRMMASSRIMSKLTPRTPRSDRTTPRLQ